MTRRIINKKGMSEAQRVAVGRLQAELAHLRKLCAARESSARDRVVRGIDVVTGLAVGDAVRFQMKHGYIEVRRGFTVPDWPGFDCIEIRTEGTLKIEPRLSNVIVVTSVPS